MLAEVLIMLAALARRQGNLPQAVEYAQASLQLEAGSLVAALNLVGQVNLQLGEQEIHLAQQAVQAQPATEAESQAMVEVGLKHVGEAQRALQQALAALDRLRQQPQHNPAACGEVEARRARCQALLHATEAFFQRM